jgi:hypothetical protein
MLHVPRPTFRWNLQVVEEGDWELIAGAGALAAVVAALGIALYWTWFAGTGDVAGPAGADLIWKLWSR